MLVSDLSPSKQSNTFGSPSATTCEPSRSNATCELNDQGTVSRPASQAFGFALRPKAISSILEEMHVPDTQQLYSLSDPNSTIKASDTSPFVAFHLPRHASRETVRRIPLVSNIRRLTRVADLSVFGADQLTRRSHSPVPINTAHEAPF